MCSDECCSEKCENRMMVVLVGVLITFCYVSWWVLVAWPWAWWSTGAGLLNMVFFNTVVGLLIYSYYNAINTAPGYVPLGWEPNDLPEDKRKEAIAASEVKDLKKTYTTESLDPERLRYCNLCKSFKPPRSHHCRDCKRCVLRMDHHCPWVNNCVGFNNHKYFLLFLNYASIGLSYELIAMIWRLVDGLRQVNRRLGGIGGTSFQVYDVILFCVNFFLTLPVTIAIISLFVYQLSCVFENQTSMEDYIIKRLKRLARREGIKFVWPYDLGTWANVRQMFGKFAKHWLVPAQHYEGDGFRYRKVKVDTEALNIEIGVHRKGSDSDDQGKKRIIHTPTKL